MGWKRLETLTPAVTSAPSPRPPLTTARSPSQVNSSLVKQRSREWETKREEEGNKIVYRCLLVHAGASLCEIQVQDGSTIELEDSGNVCYSLWVSFAEIYNEFIYDLLAEEPNPSRRRRPALRLAEDKNHNHFIKGKEVLRIMEPIPILLYSVSSSLRSAPNIKIAPLKYIHSDAKFV